MEERAACCEGVPDPKPLPEPDPGQPIAFCKPWGWRDDVKFIMTMIVGPVVLLVGVCVLAR